MFIDSLSINKYKIDSLRSDLNFKSDLLSFEGTVNQGPFESVKLSLKLPVHIAFNDSTYLLKDNTGFSASVSADSLDLREISTSFPVKNTSVRGFASAHLDMKNKLSDPVITGALDIYEGGFVNTQFGAKYNNITLKSKIEKSQLVIDEFSASAGSGKLSLVGSVNLNSTDSVNLNDFNLDLKANNFQALKSTGAELNFNSDINLNGSEGNSRVKGNIKVNSSKINVDYFEGILSTKKNDPNPPLLIKALRDTVTVKAASDTSKTKPWFSGTSFYKNLKGEVILDLPGNTWVTGKDMNFELEGTL